MKKKDLNAILAVIEKHKALGVKQLHLDIAEAKLDVHSWHLRTMMLYRQVGFMMGDVKPTKIIMNAIIPNKAEGQTDDEHLHHLALFKLMFINHADELKTNYTRAKKYDMEVGIGLFKKRIEEKHGKEGETDIQRRWRAALACHDVVYEAATMFGPGKALDTFLDRADQLRRL